MFNALLFWLLVGITTASQCGPLSLRAEVVCHLDDDLDLGQIDPCKCTLLVVKKVKLDNELRVTSDLDITKLRNLRTKNPDLRLIISLGGATKSTLLAAVTSSVAGVSNFTTGIVDFVETNDFDGVEIDWQDVFVGSAGLKSKDDFTSLIKVLRLSLDQQVHSLSRRSIKEPLRNQGNRKRRRGVTGKATTSSNRKNRRRIVRRKPTVDTTQTAATPTSRGSVKFKDYFNPALLQAIGEQITPVDTETDVWNTEHVNIPAERLVRPLEKRIGSGKVLMLTLPVQPEILVKGYDLKSLTSIVDLFSVSTQNLTTTTVANKTFTYHHARLMGVSDIENADSLLDLIVSMGVPLDRLVMGLPSSAGLFTLTNPEQNTPRSAAVSAPSWIPYSKVCSLFKKGNWTVERDEDLTAPYAFRKNQWIAFDDALSLKIKSKYALLRGLAGVGLYNLEGDDTTGSCGQGRQPLLTSVLDTFTQLSRRPRRAILRSLVKDLETSESAPGASITSASNIRSSPFRIVRVVDKTGSIRAVRSNTDTKHECSRQGYYRDPEDCSQFYRCVKFNQLIDDYTVFEYFCPAGLVFDDRWEICAWPSTAPPCDGSSEIFPIPRNKNVCTQEGFFVDPENCRWFYACRDYYGEGDFTVYEFRCPFGLAYDEGNQICNWPWLVSTCGEYATAGLEGRSRGKAIDPKKPFRQHVIEKAYVKDCLDCDDAEITVNGKGVYHEGKGIIVSPKYFAHTSDQSADSDEDSSQENLNVAAQGNGLGLQDLLDGKIHQKLKNPPVKESTKEQRFNTNQAAKNSAQIAVNAGSSPYRPSDTGSLAKKNSVSNSQSYHPNSNQDSAQRAHDTNPTQSGTGYPHRTPQGTSSGRDPITQTFDEIHGSNSGGANQLNNNDNDQFSTDRGSSTYRSPVRSGTISGSRGTHSSSHAGAGKITKLSKTVGSSRSRNSQETRNRYSNGVDSSLPRRSSLGNASSQRRKDGYRGNVRNKQRGNIRNRQPINKASEPLSSWTSWSGFENNFGERTRPKQRYQAGTPQSRVRQRVKIVQEPSKPSDNTVRTYTSRGSSNTGSTPNFHEQQVRKSEESHTEKEYHLTRTASHNTNGNLNGNYESQDTFSGSDNTKEHKDYSKSEPKSVQNHETLQNSRENFEVKQSPHYDTNNHDSEIKDKQSVHSSHNEYAGTSQGAAGLSSAGESGLKLQPHQYGFASKTNLNSKSHQGRGVATGEDYNEYSSKSSGDVHYRDGIQQNEQLQSNGGLDTRTFGTQKGINIASSQRKTNKDESNKPHPHAQTFEFNRNPVNSRTDTETKTLSIERSSNKPHNQFQDTTSTQSQFETNPRIYPSRHSSSSTLSNPTDGSHFKIQQSNTSVQGRAKVSGEIYNQHSGSKLNSPIKPIQKSSYIRPNQAENQDNNERIHGNTYTHTKHRESDPLPNRSPSAGPSSHTTSFDNPSHEDTIVVNSKTPETGHTPGTSHFSLEGNTYTGATRSGNEEQVSAHLAKYENVGGSGFKSTHILEHSKTPSDIKTKSYSGVSHDRSDGLLHNSEIGRTNTNSHGGSGTSHFNIPGNPNAQYPSSKTSEVERKVSHSSTRHSIGNSHGGQISTGSGPNLRNKDFRDSSIDGSIPEHNTDQFNGRNPHVQRVRDKVGLSNHFSLNSHSAEAGGRFGSEDDRNAYSSSNQKHGDRQRTSNLGTNNKSPISNIQKNRDDDKLTSSHAAHGGRHSTSGQKTDRYDELNLTPEEHSRNFFNINRNKGFTSQISHSKTIEGNTDGDKRHKQNEKTFSGVYGNTNSRSQHKSSQISKSDHNTGLKSQQSDGFGNHHSQGDKTMFGVAVPHSTESRGEVTGTRYSSGSNSKKASPATTFKDVQTQSDGVVNTGSHQGQQISQGVNRQSIQTPSTSGGQYNHFGQSAHGDQEAGERSSGLSNSFQAPKPSSHGSEPKNHGLRNNGAKGFTTSSRGVSSHSTGIHRESNEAYRPGQHNSNSHFGTAHPGSTFSKSNQHHNPSVKHRANQNSYTDGSISNGRTTSYQSGSKILQSTDDESGRSGLRTGSYNQNSQGSSPGSSTFSDSKTSRPHSQTNAQGTHTQGANHFSVNTNSKATLTGTHSSNGVQDASKTISGSRPSTDQYSTAKDSATQHFGSPAISNVGRPHSIIDADPQRSSLGPHARSKSDQPSTVSSQSRYPVLDDFSHITDKETRTPVSHGVNDHFNINTNAKNTLSRVHGDERSQATGKYTDKTSSRTTFSDDNDPPRDHFQTSSYPKADSRPHLAGHNKDFFAGSSVTAQNNQKTDGEENERYGAGDKGQASHGVSDHFSITTNTKGTFSRVHAEERGPHTGKYTGNTSSRTTSRDENDPPKKQFQTNSYPKAGSRDHLPTAKTDFFAGSSVTAQRNQNTEGEDKERYDAGARVPVSHGLSDHFSINTNKKNTLSRVHEDERNQDTGKYTDDTSSRTTFSNKNDPPRKHFPINSYPNADSRSHLATHDQDFVDGSSVTAHDKQKDHGFISNTQTYVSEEHGTSHGTSGGKGDTYKQSPHSTPTSQSIPEKDSEKLLKDSVRSSYSPNSQVGNKHFNVQAKTVSQRLGSEKLSSHGSSHFGGAADTTNKADGVVTRKDNGSQNRYTQPSTSEGNSYKANTHGTTNSHTSGSGQFTHSSPRSSTSGSGQYTHRNPHSSTSGSGQYTPSSPQSSNSGSGQYTKSSPQSSNSGSGQYTQSSPQSSNSGSGQYTPSNPQSSTSPISSHKSSTGKAIDSVAVAQPGSGALRNLGIRKSTSKTPSILSKFGSTFTYHRFGADGSREYEEKLGPEVCERAGLFRHPDSCDKFYECYWDRWLGRFTLHVFDCPISIIYDSGITACNWPFAGPPCHDKNHP